MKTKRDTKSKKPCGEKKIVALDLGDRKHEVCVLSRADGRVLERGKIANTREAMAE